MTQRTIVYACNSVKYALNNAKTLMQIPEFEIRRSEIANELYRKYTHKKSIHTHRWWCYFIKNMVNRCHLYMNNMSFSHYDFCDFFISQLFIILLSLKMCIGFRCENLNSKVTFEHFWISMFELFTLKYFMLWRTKLSWASDGEYVPSKTSSSPLSPSAFKKYSSISECN